MFSLSLVLSFLPIVPSPTGPAQEGPAIITGTVEFSPEEIEHMLELSPLPDPPDDPTNRYYRDEGAALLGQWIFFDPRFSGTGTVSCFSCHDPQKGWADGLAVADVRVPLERNSMSLWNVAYNRWFFWDGRADSLWAQALQPLEDPNEHGGSRLQYVHLVASDPDLTRAYTEVFGELADFTDRQRFPAQGRPVPGDPSDPHDVAWRGMTPEDRNAVNRVFANLGKSLGAFQSKLVSRRAPFDLFIEGVRERDAHKQRSLTESARRGLKIFAGRGRCHLCHSGPNFSDSEFHNDRIPQGEGGSNLDQGRWAGIERVVADPFNGLGRYSDAPTGEARNKLAYLIRTGHNYGEFKTPSLRNVVLSAPYMHAGQFEDLNTVLRFYSTLENATPVHQPDKLLVALQLTEEEIADLIAFLQSLTDANLDPALMQAPTRPYPTASSSPAIGMEDGR